MEKNLNPFTNLPIGHKLTAWYIQNARDLPWRKTKDPYSIFVSEIMLQQTRVEAVKPYYTRFLNVLPDIPALAAVDEDVLLKLWEGLGYYSRVRNMQKTAQILMAAHRGQFPKSVDGLLELPGIGPYTAGAIASFAYHIAAPAVDGNVLRVLSRLNSSAVDIGRPQTRRFAEETIRAMMAGHDPSLFNQGLMELGATVCLPNGEIRCNACPVHGDCKGLCTGDARHLPYKEKKAPRRIENITVFALFQNERYAVKKRPNKGLLASLYELPNVNGVLDEANMLDRLRTWCISPQGAISRYERKHIFTHREWHIRVYSMQVKCDRLPVNWEWTADEKGSAKALPTAFKICLPK